MIAIQKEIDLVLNEIISLQRNLRKKSLLQVRSSNEKRGIKAVCYAWINNHRTLFSKHFSTIEFNEIEDLYASILKSSDLSTSRSKYFSMLKELRKLLSEYRSLAMSTTSNIRSSTPDLPPSFSRLIPDIQMQEILKNRWNECVTCVIYKAPLAAIVMMGGLMEGLLLAKINSQTDKSKVFCSKYAPKDKTGNILPLKEWRLKDYIDVAHNLNWISKSAKDVSIVVRDYRNYIHPHKEFSHGVNLNSADARIFWEISKEISKQLLE